MKKNLLVGIAILMLMTPMTMASPMLSAPSQKSLLQKVNVSQENFTHTVLAEYGTTTTCPYCVIASGQLYSIYSSGDIDFYYVSLVGDEGNTNVLSRLTELGITSIPDVYFDGGYRRLLGAQNDEQPYRNALTYCGVRDVPDIDLDVTVGWKGGGTLSITVTVTNNEAEDYNGHLRVYVVEKTSRWEDNGGHPYHFGVLDIPIDKDLSAISSSKPGHPRPLSDTYTFKKTWFGSLHGFGDITKDNTLVIASVFDPDSEDAVQTAAAEPTSNSESTLNILFQTHPIFAVFTIISHQIRAKILSHT